MDMRYRMPEHVGDELEELRMAFIEMGYELDELPEHKPLGWAMAVRICEDDLIDF